ncbi:hypothetical protein K9M09_01840 [Patescibacteria group bacterium]|nr:hypothetical protein [Patescibacteria group bacterium]
MKENLIHFDVEMAVAIFTAFISSYVVLVMPIFLGRSYARDQPRMKNHSYVNIWCYLFIGVLLNALSLLLFLSYFSLWVIVTIAIINTAAMSLSFVITYLLFPAWQRKTIAILSGNDQTEHVAMF